MLRSCDEEIKCDEKVASYMLLQQFVLIATFT